MGDVQPPRSVWADVARYSDLGLRFVVATVGGAGCGYWLDRKFELAGQFPLLTLVGFFLGLAIGMYSLFRALRPAKAASTAGDQR